MEAETDERPVLLAVDQKFKWPSDEFGDRTTSREQRDPLERGDPVSERAFPIITAEDLEEARAFYEQLGFSATYRFPSDGEPRYLTMSRGTSSVGIGAASAGDEERFGLWVYVEDVDGTLERLRTSGVEVVAEPEDQPWGERVARVRDPEGNLIYLGSAS
jgi:predicted enzyme related to lactoylglutathione lyase